MKSLSRLLSRTRGSIVEERTVDEHLIRTCVDAEMICSPTNDDVSDFLPGSSSEPGHFVDAERLWRD